MSKRASIESKVVGFFSSAPLDAVEVVLGIVGPMVRERRKAAQPASTARVVRVKKPKKMNASTQTSFEPAALAQ